MMDFYDRGLFGDGGLGRLGQGRLAWVLKRFVPVAIGVWLLFAILQHHRDLAKIRVARAETVVLSRAVKAFFVDNKRCPGDLDELVHPPEGAKPYLRSVSLDPWGHPYWLICPAENDTRGMRVESAGSEGIYGGRRSIGRP